MQFIYSIGIVLVMTEYVANRKTSELFLIGVLQIKMKEVGWRYLVLKGIILVVFLVEVSQAT